VAIGDHGDGEGTAAPGDGVAGILRRLPGGDVPGPDNARRPGFPPEAWFRLRGGRFALAHQMVAAAGTVGNDGRATACPCAMVAGSPDVPVLIDVVTTVEAQRMYSASCSWLSA